MASEKPPASALGLKVHGCGRESGVDFIRQAHGMSVLANRKTWNFAFLRPRYRLWLNPPIRYCATMPLHPVTIQGARTCEQFLRTMTVVVATSRILLILSWPTASRPTSVDFRVEIQASWLYRCSQHTYCIWKAESKNGSGVVLLSCCYDSSAQR
jgi:hypothetical protein